MQAAAANRSSVCSMPARLCDSRSLTPLMNLPSLVIGPGTELVVLSVITQDCPVGWAKVKQRTRVYAAAAASLIMALFTGVLFVSLFSGKHRGVTVGELIPFATPTPQPLMGAIAAPPRNTNTNANTTAQTWGGSFYFVGSQNLNLGSGGVTMNNTNTTITVSNNTLTVGGAISGSGTLMKAGSGTLILAGANTYTNNTTVSAGTLELVQPVLATNSIVSIGNSATLRLDVRANAPTTTLSSTVREGKGLTIWKVRPMPSLQSS